MDEYFKSFSFKIILCSLQSCNIRDINSPRGFILKTTQKKGNILILKSLLYNPLRQGEGGEPLLNLFKICEPVFAADAGVSQPGRQIVLVTLLLLHPQGGKLRCQCCWHMDCDSISIGRCILESEAVNMQNINPLHFFVALIAVVCHTEAVQTWSHIPDSFWMIQQDLLSIDIIYLLSNLPPVKSFNLSVKLHFQ